MIDRPKDQTDFSFSGPKGFCRKDKIRLCIASRDGPIGLKAAKSIIIINIVTKSKALLALECRTG